MKKLSFVYSARAEPNNILRFLKVDGLVEQLRGELIPGFLVLGDLAGQGLGHFPAKLVVAPGPAGAAEKGEFTGKSPLLEQFEQRRDQFAVGQVTTGAENHKTLGCDDAFLSESDP